MSSTIHLFFWLVSKFIIIIIIIITFSSFSSKNQLWTIKSNQFSLNKKIDAKGLTEADPGFFLGGGALVSFSTSTPINYIVFFFAEYQLY